MLAVQEELDAVDLPEACGSRNAPRLLRIWQLVEDVAAHPGRTRKELAHQYSLSERQVQADLNFIRDNLGLPLVRQDGYRFSEDHPLAKATPQLSLLDVVTLLMVIGRAANDPGLRIPPDRVQSLLAAMPRLAPLHLRPLVAVALAAGVGHISMFTLLAQALVSRTYVRLLYPTKLDGVLIREPIVQPQVIMPYGDRWYLIGQCRQRNRLMLFPLEHVLSVSAA